MKNSRHFIRQVELLLCCLPIIREQLFAMSWRVFLSVMASATTPSSTGSRRRYTPRDDGMSTLLAMTSCYALATTGVW